MISKAKLFSRKNSRGYLSHSVVIYYSKSGKSFRYTTGVIVEDKDDFNLKTGKVVNGENIAWKNLKVSLVQQEIEKAITTLIVQNEGELPLVSELEEYLSKLNEMPGKPMKKNVLSLNEYVEEFYEYKKENSAKRTGSSYRVITTYMKKFNTEKGFKTVDIRLWLYRGF